MCSTRCRWAFRRFCAQSGLQPEEVAYFGDDIPDIQVLRACGLGIAPADAAPEARQAADYVTSLYSIGN